MAGLDPSRRAVVRHVPLGKADYRGTLEFQRALRARRAEGAIDDLIITVEHEPVFTIGRRGSSEHLLVSREAVEEEGIAIIEVDRGGGITYHGPGQLVVYPILDLRAYGRDIKAYIGRLEEAAIRTLIGYGVDAVRAPGRPGVWVEGRKIASVGVHVRRWITTHGLALNVEVDRRHFAMIRPCGLPVEVVSLNELIAQPVNVEEVGERFLAQAASLFEWSVQRMPSDEVRSVGG